VDGTTAIPGLTDLELQALRGAAVWYAKYHSGTIATAADDAGAYAVAEREEYLALITALEKLGVRVRVPDALQQAA
jgi:hypothetical protein